MSWMWAAARMAGAPTFERVPEGRVVGMDISDEMVRRARRNHVALETRCSSSAAWMKFPGREFFTRAISVESAYYWPIRHAVCARFFE